MENAPKALLIAAVILIAMAVIGLGVYTFWKTNESAITNANRMTAEEMQVFNNQFSDRQKIFGSEVKSVEQKVHASNKKYNTEEYNYRKVELKYEDPLSSTDDISVTKLYNITLKYENGIVNEVIIKGL